MQNYLDEIVKPQQKVNNLFNTLGVLVEKVAKDEAVLRLPLGPQFLQGGKSTGGGIIATMADECMAHVVLPNLEAGQRTVTIEMNIRYLRGIAEGELVARAKIVRRVRTVITAEAEVCSGEGVLLATAGASFWVG